MFVLSLVMVITGVLKRAINVHLKENIELKSGGWIYWSGDYQIPELTMS